jgi:hypothetical protein
MSEQIVSVVKYLRKITLHQLNTRKSVKCPGYAVEWALEYYEWLSNFVYWWLSAHMKICDCKENKNKTDVEIKNKVTNK